MTSLTSKERVLATIERTPTDRVPLDFSAVPALLTPLQKACGAKNYADLLNALHVDIVDIRSVVDPVYRGPVPWERWPSRDVKENFWGMRTTTRETLTGAEEMYCQFILHDASSIADLEKHRWPAVDWFDFSDFNARLAPWRDRAVMASGASVWQHPSFLRGLDNLMMDLVLHPEIAEFLLDKFTRFYLEYFDKMFSAAPVAVDILRIADDIGMQDRLLIGPDLVSTFLFPRIRRLVDMAHSHGVKVMFHSCGSITPLIDSLIALGVDILDPIQVSARAMDPATLKKDFGDRICFHGAIDTQYLLPCGTPQEVETTAASMIDILGSNGGYILSPSHVLQTDVPLENILILYETAYRRSCAGQ